MAFDPSKVDLSLVEPALRPEVLRRVTVLEEFTRSRGPSARKKACEALGISQHQLYILARAWSARRRAEDVTLRATKRHRPTTLHPDVMRIIEAVADETIGGPGVVIVRKVVERCIAEGLTPPAPPTIGKYVRERAADRGVEPLNLPKADLLIDAIVCDIPVVAPGGGRARPQLLIMADGAGGGLISIEAVPGSIQPRDLAVLLIKALPTIPASSNSAMTPTAIVISLPKGLVGVEELQAALAGRGVLLVPRTGIGAMPGQIATALLGTMLGGYKLRRKLTGQPMARRKAGYPQLDPAQPSDAAGYLANVARDGMPPPNTILDAMSRGWLDGVADSLEKFIPATEAARDAA